VLIKEYPGDYKTLLFISMTQRDAILSENANLQPNKIGNLFCGMNNQFLPEIRISGCKV
jgi:hypothetical protein